MITRKNLQLLLIVYLLFSLIPAVLVFQYRLESKKRIDVTVHESDYQSLPSRDPHAAIMLLMAPFVWLFGMGILALHIAAWISLFLFWRIGPTFFVISVILLYILFPLIGAWYHQQAASWIPFISSKANSDSVYFLQPLHSINLLLSGAILAITQMKDGKRLFGNGQNEYR